MCDSSWLPYPSGSNIHLLFITKVVQREALYLLFSNVWLIILKSLPTLHQFTIMIHMFLCIIHKRMLDNHLDIVLMLVVMF
jgi:hypothetical protein